MSHILVPYGLSSLCVLSILGGIVLWHPFLFLIGAFSFLGILFWLLWMMRSHANP